MAVKRISGIVTSVSLQAVSKPQIAFEDKAQPDEKAQHIQICEHFEESCNAVIGR